VGFTTTLMTAAAQQLHNENVGAYKPAGNYLPDDVAITFDLFHSTVNKAIRITTYPVSEDLTTDTVIGLQLWVRGMPNNRASAKDIADRATDALHGLQRVDWGGIPIVLVVWKSQTSHGLDANGREEISINFYAQLTLTGTHRRD
jgi:hypothetical protein